MTSPAIHNFARRASRTRSGVALVMVVALIGAAALMSYALLEGALSRATASENLVRATASDVLAESGLNLAMYYLQNPSVAPSLNSDNHWPGATGIVLSSSVRGTVDVTITRVSGSTFTISSTGRSITGASAASRTTGATVKLNGTFTQTSPMSVGVDMTVGDRMTVTNLGGTAVRSAGRVTLSGSGKIVGNLIAPAYTLSGGTLSGSYIPAAASNVVPASTQVTDYRTYTHNGQTYNATKLASTTISGTLGTTASNPAGVYWTDVNTSFATLATVNGTLILRDGAMLIVPAGIKTVTPMTGFPALVLDGQLRMQGAANLTINGLAYVRKGIIANNTTSGNSASSQLTVNGAILFSESGIDSTFRGKLDVLYNAARLSVPDFSVPLLTPQSVKVISWNPS